MELTKSQDKLNNAEWENSDNWSTLYFSKKDSRTFVPKRNPKQGRAINFGSASGARWIYYLFGIFFMLGCTLGATFTLFLMLIK